MMASTATVKVNFILLGMSALLVLDVRVDGRFDVICGVKNAAVLGLVRCTKLVRIFFWTHARPTYYHLAAKRG